MLRRLFTAFAALAPVLIAGAVPASGQNAYITNGGANTVSVIATASGTVVGSPIGVGNTPYGVAITPDGSKVYVANSGTSTISVIATASNAVTGTITVGGNPIGLAVTADGGKVYVANSGTNTVSVIATATDTVIATIAVGANPSGVVVTPDGSKIYVANSGDSTVSLILGSINLATAAIPVGANPLGVAVTPDGSKVYVANQSGNSVSVIATDATAVTATIPVGLAPAGVAVTPDGKKVYVANSASNTVSVIGTADNKIVATIVVGNNPVGIAVTPDGGRVFVANQGANNVSVIATASNTVIGAPIAVGAVPVAFGSFIAPARLPPGMTATPVAFATQAVAGAGGALTIPGSTSIASSVFTTGPDGGSALVTFTLPAGVSFATSPTAIVDGTAFTAAVPSGASGSNSITFNITLGANLFLQQGTLGLSSFQIAGATVLATPTASGFTISGQFTGSNGATPSLNQMQTSAADLATSADALAFSASASPGVTINVMPPGFGRLVSQPVPVGTANVARADLGTLSTMLVGGLQNAMATGQFTFTDATLAVTMTGNFTGVSGAYIAPPGTLSCSTTFDAQPSGAVAGAFMNNTITFAGVGAGFNAAGAGPRLQEVCIYFTGTTIIGQNTSGFPATGTVDTTTQTTARLATQTYNGTVQPILYASNSTAYAMYIRVVNRTAGPIHAFAIVQTDGGATGQAQIESALAANSNDLIPVATIIANAGIAAPPPTRVSMVLLGPVGVGFENLVVGPGGTLTQLP